MSPRDSRRGGISCTAVSLNIIILWTGWPRSSFLRIKVWTRPRRGKLPRIKKGRDAMTAPHPWHASSNMNTI